MIICPIHLAKITSQGFFDSSLPLYLLPAMKLIGFLLFFLICFCGEAQIVKPDNELLWEITRPGSKTKSYLFGTLHSNDKRIFQLADSVYFALDNSTCIVLETDIFKFFNQRSIRDETNILLYDNQGNPYTGSNDASITNYGDENGMPQFLDAYFHQYSALSDKKLVPLESNNSQLALIKDLPTSENNLIVPKRKRDLEGLTELYLKGELYFLDRFIRKNMSNEPGLYSSIIEDRNMSMAIRLDSCLKKEKVFCAVGAGHLYGNLGMIQLLRNKGYQLRCVPAIYSELPIKEKSNVQALKRYDLRLPDQGLLVTFPGKPEVSVLEEGHIQAIYKELGQGNTYVIEIVPFDETLSFEQYAAIYIASPPNTKYRYGELEDGTIFYEGISDVYPEGLHWIRVLTNGKKVLIAKAYGGNKFMNSKRSQLFFDKIVFE